MLNESSRNEIDSGPDIAGAFHASIKAARRRQNLSWLLSGAWLIAIVAIALYFGYKFSNLKAQMKELQREVDLARSTSEMARLQSLKVYEVRSMVIALQGSLERKAEVEGRSLSPSDKERYILKLVDAEIDRQPLTTSEQELLQSERKRVEEEDTPRALYLQGSGLLSSKPDQAVAKLTAAVKKAPRYEPAWVALGKVYRLMGNFESADQALTNAIKLNPTRSYARAERCYVRINLRDAPPDEMVQDCTRVIEMKPTDWVGYHYRAFAHYISRKEDREAEQDWRKAAELRDQPAGSLENLGMIYLRQRNWQKAFDNAQTVNLISNNSSWNWLFLYIAASNLGRKEVADQAHSKWLSLKKPEDVKSLTVWLSDDLKAYVTRD